VSPDTRQAGAAAAPGDLYEADFVLWTEAQAEALRRQADMRPDAGVDYENLIDEVETLGRSIAHALRSHLTQVLLHLAKLEHSRTAEPRAGWREEVGNARLEIEDLVEESPSLRRKLDPGKAWRRVRRLTEDAFAREPGPPPDLPETCPYDLETQVLADRWFPPNRHGIAP